MKLLTQRLVRIFKEMVRALGAYRDLFLAWLDAAGSHLFPTPVKVRVPSQQRPRPRAAKPRR